MTQTFASALVLDFGGVISRMLFETHDLTERALGLTPGTLTWRGPFDPSTDPLWQDMQADKLSERDYWMTRTREVGRLVGEDWDSMETFVQRARGADVEAVIRPEAIETIHMAKAAGKRLAILSNELDLFYGADFRSRLSLLEDFELIVDATYTGILKPDARAYMAVTEQLGLPASECVFVDDQKRNADGGMKAGMQVVHFDVLEPVASFAKAKELLGL
ncbi:HAD-IA family hydrolase [Rhodoferax sp.]|uniref:HAD-IA family hydrolase n=1 Tax=Rhodoferax sp. TaxID=50421 RepID=UPI002ACEC804|nr:HAD-IA family hydrolase [Rhodoferax sp.]MDZ7920517.1 HAD-IA family hydrolase [Rhodoferax sp.]